MKITKQSILSGIQSTQNIPMTEEEYCRFFWRGESIDEICPHISAYHKEFLFTGITEAEWEALQGNAYEI